MKRILLSFSRGVLIFLALGIMLIAMNASVFFVSIKPATSFEDLLEKEPKSGMHIKGDAANVFDCFAKEETWTERSDGSRTPAKNSHYYYSVIALNSVFALEIPADEYSAMEKLSEETYYHMMGGEAPTTKVAVDGVMKKMDKETKALFLDYLEANDFSEEEIEAMGDFLIVEQYSMTAVRVMFLIGVVLVAIAIFLFIRNYNGQEPKEPEQPQIPDEPQSSESPEL